MGHTVCIIDDESTDISIEIINEFINKNRNYKIKLIEKKNSGLVKSLILGLNIVETDFIYYISSDDIPNSENILNCYEKLKENKKLKFCIAGATNKFENNLRETIFYNEEHEKFVKKSNDDRRVDFFKKFPFPIFLLQSTIFRTSFLAENHTWNGALALDDTPIFYKILSNNNPGDDFIFEPNILVVKYRHHENNSYKKLYRQFTIISEAVNLLAPDKIRNKSLQSVATYHLVKSITSFQINDFKKIIKNKNGNTVKMLFLTTVRLVQTIIQKLYLTIKTQFFKNYVG
jgi:glycosyltransferase involved in cell wall biosynthesis